MKENNSMKNGRINPVCVWGGGRNEMVDVSKGLAILLMVIGHSGLPLVFHDFIYSFHMPFFFIISGVLYKGQYNLRDYFYNKVKKLLIPFLLYATINIILRSMYYNESIITYIFRHSYSGCESALWFLPILFLASMTNHVVRNKYYLPFLILLAMALSSFLSLNNISLPWSLSILPLSIAFVFIGRLYNIIVYYVDNNNGKKLLLASIVSVIVIFMVSHYYTLECKDNTLSEPIVILVVTAVIGSIMLLCISKFLKKLNKVNRLLSYIGKNTMLIVGLSQITLKYENLVISQFAIIKYLILFATLLFLIYLKNKVLLLRQLNM